MGNREGDNFLDVLVTLRKSKKRLGGSLFIAWSAKSWSLGFKGITWVNMHDASALYVLNFHWLHVWVEFLL